VILSRHNPRIREIRALTGSSRERADAGLLVVEGLRCVDTALRCGAELVRLYLAEPSRESEALARVERAGAQTEADVERVDREVLGWASSVQSSTDCVAVVRRPARSLGVLGADVNRALVLEHVGDPGNVGSAIRSAVAAGVDCVILAGRCADWSNPKVVRGSAGTVFALPVVESRSVRDALATLALTGIGASSEGGTSVYEARLPSRGALVLGSEARGLSRDARNACDSLVTIPMVRDVESLNVAAAAAVCLFLMTR